MKSALNRFITKSEYYLDDKSISEIFTLPSPNEDLNFCKPMNV